MKWTFPNPRFRFAPSLTGSALLYVICLTVSNGTQVQAAKANPSFVRSPVRVPVGNYSFCLNSPANRQQVIIFSLWEGSGNDCVEIVPGGWKNASYLALDELIAMHERSSCESNEKLFPHIVRGRLPEVGEMICPDDLSARFGANEVSYEFGRLGRFRGFRDVRSLIESKVIFGLSESFASLRYGIVRFIRRPRCFAASGLHLAPLKTGIVDGESKQNHAHNGYSNGNQVTPDVDVKWRFPLCASGIVFAFVIGAVGLGLINSAGLIEDISIPNLFKVMSGVLFLAIAWIVTQAALDVLDLGKVYLRDLL
jgi:hypothetical protein